MEAYYIMRRDMVVLHSKKKIHMYNQCKFLHFPPQSEHITINIVGREEN